MTIDCRLCPLRPLPAFDPMSEAEVEFMVKFKVGELVIEPRTTILLQGSTSPQLFTALAGWGLRYQILPDGARQVINFVMPGDLIGLQAGLMVEMRHSVDSVTRMTLCVFQRRDLFALFKTMPQRGYDLTWLAACEELFLGDMLSTVGQRNGIERVAWGLVAYYKRARAIEKTATDAVPMPYRQQDWADALGLSLVHTNKMLKRLRSLGLMEIAAGSLRIPDLEALAAVANMDASRERQRPLM